MAFSENQNFLRLLNDLRSGINLADYSDENWCKNYRADVYFLYVLCWARWRTERQENVWKEVRNRFDELGKELCAFQPVDVERLCESYPLPWQKKWLQQLVDFLSENSLTVQNFVDILGKMGYENARRKLQEIMETDAEKIVDCWLRDIVKLDAFPIDTRIRDLLKKYEIPVDSDFIIERCKQNNVPIRAFARALYDNAGTLKKSAK